MTGPGPTNFPGPLVGMVEESLALLEDYTDRTRDISTRDALPSLLEQCNILAQEIRHQDPEPVRLIHHLAGTGGTLICKWLATCANIVLLSEIDPLSRMQVPQGKWPFAPTDVLRLLRCNARSADTALIEAVFLGGLKALYDQLGKRGQRLILRDHAHSHYCVGTEVEDRPSLLDLVRRQHPVRAVLTVRHPLDSYLSITNNNFLHFRPATLEEYCRRYVAFLDGHKGIPIFSYENFVREPEETFSEICKTLCVPGTMMSQDLWRGFRLSGDSGRRGSDIGPRPRRELSDALLQEIADSATYKSFCERLGYAVEHKTEGRERANDGG